MPYPSPANFFTLQSLRQELFDLRIQKRDAEIHFTLGLIEEHKMNFYGAWLHYLYINNDHYLLSCASNHKDLMSANLTQEMLNIAKIRAAEVTHRYFNTFIQSRDRFYDLLSKGYEKDSLDTLKKTQKKICDEIDALRKKHGFLSLIQISGKYSLYSRISYLYDLDLLLNNLIKIKTNNTSSSESPDLEAMQYGQNLLKYIRNRLAIGSHSANIRNYPLAVVQLNHTPGCINPASFSNIQEYVEALRSSLENCANRYTEYFKSVLVSEEASHICKSTESKLSLKN